MRSQSARVEPGTASKLDQRCSRDRTSLRPESRYDAFRVVPKKMFATECINPGGLLEETVIFVGAVRTCVRNCCWFMKWNLLLAHFLSLLPVAKSVLVWFSASKKFCTALNEFDQSF